MTSRGNDKYRAAKVFHDNAQVYDSWFEGSLVYKIELDALASLQSQLYGPKLEIGVGPGRFASDLDIALGIDPAFAPLKLASERGIVCCQAFGEELPIKAGAIGTIYVLLALCFFSEPQKVLYECSRALKENGRLIIGMIPAESIWGRNLAAKKEAGHDFYRHARFYKIEVVENLLTKINMRIIEYRSTLYQAPESIEYVESPKNTLDEQAGFLVVVAEKIHG